ncbi:ribonuclease H-like domain-containing protein [Tanacetum coccineum]
MYSVDLKNIVPKGGLTCLFAKATSDESKLWHRRLGHLNFKTMNKLVKGNLVRGLPSKLFENDQTCVACQKGKQHRASSTKDETSGILKSFITGIENLVDHKVKVIRCDNGTEFKNREMNQFCEMKGLTILMRLATQNEVNAIGGKTSIKLLFDPNMPALEDYSIFDFSRNDEDDGSEADMNNLDTTIQVSPNPTTRIHKDHPLDQVIGNLQSATQIRKMLKNLEEHGFVRRTQKGNSCMEGSKLDRGYAGRASTIQATISLEFSGFTKYGIDYDEVFVPVARIEAIRLFLAYASFKDFMVYQMDGNKVSFFNRNIKEASSRARYETFVNISLDNGFKDGKLTKPYSSQAQSEFYGKNLPSLGLQSKAKEGCIFISQDKYVDEIFKENLGLQKSRLQVH